MRALASLTWRIDVTTLRSALGPVLVANRGEIALRVLRGCRELGLETVAVYSEADRDAPWLRSADQAWLLGPAAPAQSYLDIVRILAVAKEAGAGAIHPGYGFLAESTAFAEAVIAAGLVWIGPPPAAIKAMGDKLSARVTAQAAGCPIVPGTLEPTRDPEVVWEFAQTHGYPVAIKAAFGGGGRGLRVVREPSELMEALEGAQREALAAFGRGEVYVERYLDRPRHIEIQVLADQHGTCLSLGERDCSTQRRHQKLIEEAPAPGLPEPIRAAMGEAAVRVAREVGYEGVGTCEFLCCNGERARGGAPDGHDFFFLEMNTRLQVEHPVTEIVTGLDLVGWQLRIAAGEPLTFAQDDVTLRGHAIEARINAEHAAASFAPSPGRITTWRAPSGPGVRVDAGVDAGFQVPAAYDSLLAKLITYGADREEARRRMLRALDEFEVVGVPTTIDFHRFAFTHPDFIEGKVSTVSVEHEWDLSTLKPAAPAEEGAGPALPSRTFIVEVGGKRLEVALFDPDAAGNRARRPPAGQRPTAARSMPVLATDRPSEHAEASPAARSEAPDPGSHVERPVRTPAPGSETLVAEMQGTIIKIAVDIGDTVTAGDLVLVLEAMKMENHILARRDGVVTQLHVQAGDVVGAGDALATIEEGRGLPART
jgi:acetyl-CoA/propionyl-CoA carboxylase, biotin carboxylase, biotin carboxyl carrier protein